jgi:hypothetical protein
VGGSFSIKNRTEVQLGFLANARCRARKLYQVRRPCSAAQAPDGRYESPRTHAPVETTWMQKTHKIRILTDASDLGPLRADDA